MDKVDSFSLALTSIAHPKAALSVSGLSNKAHNPGFNIPALLNKSNLENENHSHSQGIIVEEMKGAVNLLEYEAVIAVVKRLLFGELLPAFRQSFSISSVYIAGCTRMIMAGATTPTVPRQFTIKVLVQTF
jgi:hypothetical protein